MVSSGNTIAGPAEVLALSLDLDDLARLGDEVEAALERGCRHVSLELVGDGGQLDSGELSQLTQARERLQAAAGQLVLVAPSRGLQEWLRLLGELHRFMLAETAVEAVELHRQHEAPAVGQGRGGETEERGSAPIRDTSSEGEQVDALQSELEAAQEALAAARKEAAEQRAEADRLRAELARRAADAPDPRRLEELEQASHRAVEELAVAKKELAAVKSAVAKSGGDPAVRIAQLEAEKARVMGEAEVEIRRLLRQQEQLRDELRSAGEMIERLGKELEQS